MRKLLLAVLVLVGLQTQAQTNLTTAVDFTVTDIHGDTHNLFNYLDNGKHVIVDCFFTTCGPCIASVPTLNQAYTDYGCNTGEIIFISIDNGESDAAVLQYENDYGGLLPSVSGNDGGGNAVISAYGISAYPTVVLIAPDRTILEQDIFPVSNITTALPNAGLNMASCAVTPTWDCTDSLEVTDVVIDNANLTMNIAIYNGYNIFLHDPYVAFTIDANGDTIQQGNPNLFGVSFFDTALCNYSIPSAIIPTYPLTIYFVYHIPPSDWDTCILTYNSTPTAITYVKVSGDRKLISIVDILGRETKGTKNEPLFYIYDDGTVEKRITIE
jgi:thiol-disulfide isomerase/thioredoxin